MRKSDLHKVSFRFAVLIGLVIITAHTVRPQPGQGAARRIDGRICGFEVISGFGAASIKSDSDARKIVQEVAPAVGVQPSSLVVKAAGVGNARACEDRGTRYILYDPDWINELIRSENSNWTARAIFAHEIGHHKKAHWILLAAERGCAASLEAEADEVAGEALAHLGATFREAQAAFRKIADEAGDECYPSRDQRLGAVARGWNRVKGVSPEPTQTPRPNRASSPTVSLDQLRALINSNAYSTSLTDSKIQATFNECSATFESSGFMESARLTKLDYYRVNQWGGKHGYQLNLQFENREVLRQNLRRGTSENTSFADLYFDSRATAERVGEMLIAIKQKCT